MLLITSLLVYRPTTYALDEDILDQVFGEDKEDDKNEGEVFYEYYFKDDNKTYYNNDSKYYYNDKDKYYYNDEDKYYYNDEDKYHYTDEDKYHYTDDDKYYYNDQDKYYYNDDDKSTIPGEPHVDYPAHTAIPNTQFQCQG